jgi:hypothetical protein
MHPFYKSALLPANEVRILDLQRTIQEALDIDPSRVLVFDVF